MELPFLIVGGVVSLGLVALLLPGAGPSGLPTPDERPALEARLREILRAAST